MENIISEVLAIYGKQAERANNLDKSMDIEAYRECLQSAMEKVLTTNGQCIKDIMDKYQMISDIKGAFNRLVRRETDSLKHRKVRQEKHETFSIDATFTDHKNMEVNRIEIIDYKQVRNAEHNEMIRHIKELLKDDIDREIFVQYQVYECTQSEIADLLGISQQAVQKRITRINAVITNSNLRNILDSRAVKQIGEITGKKQHIEQSYDTSPNPGASIAPDTHKADIRKARRAARAAKQATINYAVSLGKIGIPTKEKPVEIIVSMGAGSNWLSKNYPARV
ncbi:MAG: sigma-70 family RNA polymerase sigma factor [Desulfobacterales bacterium]|jgi:RNA polymerase sigma factor (sigma-70 family)|nr:sigma-70 family RNA polymerase sigma factor [Desulfobacterales bacterium]